MKSPGFGRGFSSGSEKEHAYMAATKSGRIMAAFA